MTLELISFAFVFLGGGFGAMARYGVGLATQSIIPRFPLSTLIANALACFILGILIGLQMKGHMDDTRRLLLATGFCGGFSTFSTFTAETWNLFQNGQASSALLNIGLSLSISLICLLLGLKIT